MAFYGKSIEDWENYVNLHITEYDIEDPRRFSLDERSAMQKAIEEIGEGQIIKIMRRNNDLAEDFSKIYRRIVHLIGRKTQGGGYIVNNFYWEMAESESGYKIFYVVIGIADYLKVFENLYANEIYFTHQYFNTADLNPIIIP